MQYSGKSRSVHPSCQFSRQAIDQNSSLLYNYALGFFHSQCGRSTISASTPRIIGQLSHYLNYYLSRQIPFPLKADLHPLSKNFKILFMRNFSLSLRSAEYLTLTCTPLLINLHYLVPLSFKNDNRDKILHHYLN